MIYPGQEESMRADKEEKAGYMIYNCEVKDLLIALDKSYQDADEASFNAALGKLEILIPNVDPVTLDGINAFLNDISNWKIDSVRKLTFN
jgi:hypothetical protein